MSHYDIAIIGAGPGGYVAAERAGAAGKKVVIFEKSHLGGVCLNEGCIPSKTLLNSAKIYKNAKTTEAYGVEIPAEPIFHLDKVMARKQKVMTTLRKGIAYQMKKYKVDVVNGNARFTDRRTIQVDDTTYTADNFLVGTGSSPIRPPIPGADQEHVLTSTGILNIETLPKRVAIVGGGVIGMEFACFFSSVGVDVVVFEMLPEIMPGIDGELAAELRKTLKGVEYNLGCRVEKIGKDSISYSCEGKTEETAADLVLMSIGRSPNIKGLGLEELGLDFDRRGIKVDEQMRTNLPNIFAIGDVTGLSPLAHSASRMGEVAIHTILGRPDRMRYNAIPGVVYTTPEIAAVGLTEAQANEQGIPVEVQSLSMRANGRFLAEHNRESGLCKVLVHRDDRRLLGVHMIGSHCSEMIFGAATMIEAEFRVQEIREMVFPHPTVSEVFREAVWHYDD
jgi:dihydrolipoamide dehydrogenase